MAEPRDDKYLDPYRQALADYGPGFKATLWGAASSQQLRFDVMIDLVSLDDCVIVDAGCGQGDFAARLLERDVAFKRYVGIDALEGMVEHARGREFSNSSFQTADFVSRPEVLAEHGPDFVCFSGTLNTMDDETARRLIERSYDAAAQGVVFNFLSDRFHERWGERDLTPARRFNTLDWIDWSMQQTSRVSFTQAYLDGHDATIAMLHD